MTKPTKHKGVTKTLDGFIFHVPEVWASSSGNSDENTKK
jgi:hypothetical protein